MICGFSFGATGLGLIGRLYDILWSLGLKHGYQVIGDDKYVARKWQHTDVVTLLPNDVLKLLAGHVSLGHRMWSLMAYATM